METDEWLRLRRWLVASGAVLAILLALDAFVVGGALDALYRQGTFGPFDFGGAKPPKRPLDATLQRARWIAAGLVLNVAISFGLAAALLCPKTLKERWIPQLARCGAGGVALGLAAAALGATQLDFASRALVAWISGSLLRPRSRRRVRHARGRARPLAKLQQFRVLARSEVPEIAASAWHP